ncbi:hypothetical protein ACJ73_04335 [Blastomyces percursus]|uniref:Glycoside hydrolase family 2 catalytic domain-containing protein n=1 Tax=Blastomyces percursus TaxID=1658174 RepID=A0A1J9R8I7_9EURO|nr:hypothetical protein ACJ73_04335 [Blastomyces percursus]
MASVKRDINHPSIVTWTPINESWGYRELKDSVQQQNHIHSLYYMTKSLDPTRSVNDNCGWEHVCDLSTFHDYSDGPALANTCKSMDGILDNKGGRHTFRPKIQKARVLYYRKRPRRPACQAGKSFDGRRQRWPLLVNVEQEVNGLYTFDRKAKLKPDLVKDINYRAKKLYFESIDSKGLKQALANIQAYGNYRARPRKKCTFLVLSGQIAATSNYMVRIIIVSSFWVRLNYGSEK